MKQYQIKILIGLSVLLIGGGMLRLFQIAQQSAHPVLSTAQSAKLQIASGSEQVAQPALLAQVGGSPEVSSSPISAPVQFVSTTTNNAVEYQNNATLVTKILTKLGLNSKSAPVTSPSSTPLQNPTIVATPNPAPETSPRPSPVVVVSVASTGAPNLDLPNDQFISSQEKDKLLAILPFSNDQFSLKNNLVTYGIDVQLAVPADQSKIAFTNWLKQNHFDGIFPEVFSYSSL